MNRTILLMLIVLLTLLSGCWDENQPERMLYINAIGVDYKEGQYEIYAQIVDFANTAKSEQPPSDQPQAEVGFAKGKTMDDAIFELYHSTDQRVYWGHLSYIVMSEEVMKNVKASPIIDLFIRYKDTRYQIWVYTTEDPVEEFLLVRPVINKAIILSKLGDPGNSIKQETLIKPLNIRELIINMNEPNHEAVIPLISIEENWKSIKESIKAPFLKGVGVMTPNGFKGFIKDDKVRGMQWMSNETKRGLITFKSDEGHDLSVVIDKVKVKVEPVVNNGDIQFDIDIKLQGTVSVIKGHTTAKELEAKVNKEVEKEIKETYEEALKKDIDIYRLSEYLYRKNVKAWKEHEKEGKVELTEDSIRKLNVDIVKLDSDRKSFKETIED